MRTNWVLPPMELYGLTPSVDMSKLRLMEGLKEQSEELALLLHQKGYRPLLNDEVNNIMNAFRKDENDA